MSRFALNPLFSKLLLASLVLMVAWVIFMKYETLPFTSEEIMRFEFAGTPDDVSFILDDWNKKEWVPLAKHSIYLDFIFIFLYTASLALGCLTVPSLTGKINLINWGMKFYRLSFLAGLADFLENLCMLEILYGEERTFFPATAWVLAFVKFLIIGSILIFLLRCVINWGATKFGFNR
jgi:hypothetical protein